MTHLVPILLRGQPVADKILAGCRARVAAIVARTGVRPGLAVVLVGGDRLAVRYLERKRQACADLGMAAFMVQLPAAATTDVLVATLSELGRDPAVHAMLLQYPLPPAVDERIAAEAIPPAKDIDCATAVNFGKLAAGVPGFTSCTAEGVGLLLAAYGVTVAGKHAVVVGRAAALVTPLANLFLAGGAVVTIGDVAASGIAELVGQGAIVVAAAGQPRCVRGEWLKEGAVVVDTGLNPGPDGPVGDVDEASARLRAAMITPVPGSIGPMTLAVLMERTARAAAVQLGVAEA